ncbi:MAG: hypothetical protein ACK4NZ_04310, partial [Tsuneonella sp.]
TSEDRADTLLGDLSVLMSEMVRARLATGAPAATGHRAIARLASAQSKIVEARQDLIRAHEDLRQIAETADTPTECPPSAQKVDAVEDTRIAA